jgi:hypothetical protein
MPSQVEYDIFTTFLSSEKIMRDILKITGSSMLNEGARDIESSTIMRVWKTLPQEGLDF